MRVPLLLLLASPALAQGAPPTRGASPPQGGPPARCDGETDSDRVLRIDEHGDVATQKGRVLKLADIRLGEGARPVLAALEREGVLLGFAGGPDRWGRRPARIVLARDGRDVAELLLREGHAFVDSGEAAGLCRPSLFAAEAEARAQWRGVWDAAFLPADESAAIGERAGRFTVVEGVVVSIGERARRTYLNFGRDFARDFTVSIPRRNWQAMGRAGLSAQALKGRRIRVRGIVEMRRGPAMEITDAQMIEWRGIDDPASAR